MSLTPPLPMSRSRDKATRQLALALVAASLLIWPVTYAAAQSTSATPTPTPGAVGDPDPGPEAAVGPTFEAGMALRNAEKFDEAIGVFAALVNADPGAHDARFQLATVLSWRQRFDESLGHWRELTARNPDRVDYALGYARVLYWNQEYDEAATQLDAIVLQRDDLLDAHILRGDVAVAAQRFDEAQLAYDRAIVLAPDNLELKGKRERAVAPPRWRLDGGATVDHYTGERAYENGQELSLGYKFSDAFTLVAGFTRLNHFKRTDIRLLLDAYYTPDPAIPLYLRLAGTPEADFLPNLEATLRALPRLVEGLLFGFAEVRYMNFDNNDLAVVQLGLRVVLVPGLAFEARWIRTVSVNNPITDAILGKLELVVLPVRLYAIVSYGQEALPPLALATVLSFAFGVGVDLTRLVAVRIDYAFELRVGAYTRHSGTLGLTLRF